MGLGAETNDHAPLRRVVAESWRRSRGFALDPDAWAREADLTEEYFAQFGDPLPAELRAQLVALRGRIATTS